MDIFAKKSLGQNFLKDEEVLKKISNSIDVSSKDLILEVGPGKGALTKYLTQKESQYLAIEIDERMKKILDKITDQIIFDDFLKVDLKEVLSHYEYDHFYVIANIPYYITTPIIEHIINSGIFVDEMVLLVQKEVAERFCAKPHTKEYGYFTLYLDYYFQVSKLFDVSKYSFDPVPNVESTIVKFKRKIITNIDEKKYFEFLKTCFQNKRKTLKNNLKKYDWNQISKLLAKHGYNEMVRAEDLTNEVFIDIFLHL